MRITDLSLVEANIVAIHPDEMILKSCDLETLTILNHYIKFPICASFGFAAKEKVSTITCTMSCGYVADMVIPNLHYRKDISEIRKHFENIFFRNDKESKQFLTNELGLHNWAWTEQRIYKTMNSKRRIYLRDIWDEAGCMSRTVCIFDFEENPSINFANFIKRKIVALIYGFYKCGSSEYENYSLPALEFLYNELHQDKSIKQEVKDLVKQDLIYY